MHRPLPVDSGSESGIDDLPFARWSGAPSRRYWLLVACLVAVCAVLVVSNTVLAIRLLAPASSPPRVAKAAAPPVSTPLESPLSEPAAEPVPPAAPPAPAVAPPASPRVARVEATPPAADTPMGVIAASAPRTSAQRTAAWMAASHGKQTAVLRVRAASRFYDDDTAGRAYWRAVLDEIERLPSP